MAGASAGAVNVDASGTIAPRGVVANVAATTVAVTVAVGTGPVSVGVGAGVAMGLRGNVPVLLLVAGVHHEQCDGHCQGGCRGLGQRRLRT